MNNNTMKLVPGGAGPEAKQIMRNMRAILDKINCNFANGKKCIIHYIKFCLHTCTHCV